jgi:hypothetical protein
MFDSAR